MSTAGGTPPIAQRLGDGQNIASLMIFIGPEGGWSDEEVASFEAAGLVACALTPTILRVETAAVTAAAVVACWRANTRRPR
jgi:16S rRNA (uracil1498-N3)-methyltransferase